MSRNLIDFGKSIFSDFLRFVLLCLLLISYFDRAHGYDSFERPRQQPSRTVHTNFGTVHGRLIRLNIFGLDNVGVVEYLGVPYAQPPLGRKRFMPPNSASKWSTAKDGSRHAPVCVQKFPNAFLASENEALKWMPVTYYRFLHRLRRLFLLNESEDCLYLNLHVPERKGKPEGALPVLVLVHGGSYSWGSGNAYNGSVLASYGQVIVVTLNYRLGIFGFLSAGYQAPTCRGNWALGDIAAALEFLRQTISAFGGDPESITLMGWDTGAALVNLLMSSPVSAPARSRSFRRAVILGGSALSSWATVSNPTDAFFYVAESLGCVTLNKDQRSESRRHESVVPDSSIHDIINCFMSATLDNITRVIRDIESPTYLNIFGPSIDGSIVANDPQHNLRQHGDLFRELDLLVGVTKNEAFHLLGNQESTQGLDREKRDQIYRTLVQNLFRYHRNEIFAAIVDEYTDWQAPIMQRDDVRNAVTKALGDGLFVAPLVNAARIHARPKRSFGAEDTDLNYGRAAFRDTATSPSGSTTLFSSSKQGTTFMYVFEHETKGLDRGRVDGAFHQEDLPYILGYPLLEQAKLNNDNALFNYTFGKEERALSEAMMRYIANFARTGDPTRPVPVRSQSGDGGVSEALSKLVWSPFVADMREAYVELSDRPKDGLFYRAHEVAFWTKFLPSLERAGETASNERHHQFSNRSTYYGVVKSIDRFAPFWQPTTSTPSSKAPTSATSQEKTSVGSQAAGISSTALAAGNLLQDRYSTILSVTVAVGCALLILNILIFAGIYHQWDKQKRFRKRMAANSNHYQQNSQPQPNRLDLVNAVMPVQNVNANSLNSQLSTPVVGGHSSLDRSRAASYNLTPPGPVGFGGNTNAGSRMPPAPPPPAPVSAVNVPVNQNCLDNDLHPTLSFRSHQNRNSTRHHQQQQPIQHHAPMHQHQQQHQQMQLQQPMMPNLVDTPGTPRGLYSEQEPLLNRAFISPTCPRHGKQAAAAAAAAMAAMEEIQV